MEEDVIENPLPDFRFFALRDPQVDDGSVTSVFGVHAMHLVDGRKVSREQLRRPIPCGALCRPPDTNPPIPNTFVEPVRIDLYRPENIPGYLPNVQGIAQRFPLTLR